MIEKTINELVKYAEIHLSLNARDKIYARNELFELLELDGANEIEVDAKALQNMASAGELLEKVRSYALDKGLVKEQFAENFCAKVMSILTPAPSKVEEIFWQKYENKKSDATDFLYDLSIKNNYIQKSAVDKNIVWRAEFDGAQYLEITINLSKPEKNNKDIAKLLKVQSSNYPLCMLCAENEGFWGNAQKPSRQNLRTIYLKLNQEDWFFQFSPYVYYDEHCIVINQKHDKMAITQSTVDKLLDFVDIFPHYFVGSNACLPIVGGSILNHEHYQGGLHLMPFHNAKERTKYFHPKFEDLEISIVEWYNSAIRIVGKSRESVSKVANLIRVAFADYSDPSAGIFSQTNGEAHNTLSPIARIKNGKYVVELILRNNITSEEHPDGVFHAHKEHFDVKSEGIGLIEAMGLFILPPRVKKAMEEDPKKFTKKYINDSCQDILKNTAIFKDDEKGRAAFERFMSFCGFEKA